MTTGLPELGSKISLISKADIRYEGRLFTLDPQECTIALSSVRSFGTEDRETQYPVPAQNQVYDYILFRGSDIKDIRVVNNVSLPNDPAIMQLSMPPSLGQQPFPQQGFQHISQIGAQIGQFGYGPMGAIGGAVGGSGLAPGMGMNRDPRGLSKPSELLLPTPVPPPDLSPAVEQPLSGDNGSMIDLLAGGSRCTTPASLGSRKSPTNDQGVQVNDKKDGRKIIRPIQPPGQRNNMQPKERKDSRGDGQPNEAAKMQNRSQGNRNQNNQHNQHNQQHQQHQQHQHQQQPIHQRQLGGWPQRGGQMRQRGRSRGGYKPSGQPNQQGGKPKNTLKFEKDYDFEQANTKFEELRSQLGKIKLEDAKTEINGDSDKKDDSGNETGAGENEQEEEHEVYYDKAKSFFDNISCEAVERSKGRSQRTDWRTERKLNSETFGVAATRRGSYRGRGGYRGAGYRGGFRGGYRNPGIRREPPGNNKPNQLQQSNNQQQQGSQEASSSQQKKPPAPVPAVQVAK